MKKLKFFAAIGLILLMAFPAYATVSSETTRVKYTCNGTTTVYAYPFKVYEDDDLLAVKALTSTGAETTLVLNTDYTVSGAGGAGGGNLTLTAGSKCGSGYTLTILRNLELTQETDYVDGQAFSAESLESAIDKVTLIQQQQAEAIGRAPKLPKTLSITDIALPNPSANNYIGWNAGATGLENKAVPAATTATQYEVDALISYGGGVNYTQATIEAALTAIGTSNKVTLLLRPGTWVISSNANWSAHTNVTFKIVPGAVISYGAFTVSIPNVDAGVYQIFTGNANMVTIAGIIKEVYPEWFQANTTPGTTDMTSGITAALYARSRGGVTLQDGQTYAIKSSLTIPANKGIFLKQSTVQISGANGLITLGGDSSFLIGEGFNSLIQHTGTQEYPILVNNTFHARLENFYLNTVLSGIKIYDSGGALSSYHNKINRLTIVGPGTGTAGKIGIYFPTPVLAAYATTVSDTLIQDIETCIKLAADANAHAFNNITIQSYVTGFDIYSAENRFTGGFAYGSSGDRDTFILRSVASYNVIIGFTQEPGATTRPYKIEDGATHNTLIMANNNSATQVDAAYGSNVVINGDWVRGGEGTFMGSALYNSKIIRHISSTETLDWGSIGASAYATSAVGCTGANVGNTVTVGMSTALPAGMVLTGAVTATNVVTVTLQNLTAGAIDLASGTIRVDVWQH